MNSARYLREIRVTSAAGNRARGWLTAAGLTIPCALGRSGPSGAKREGDGATPVGRFGLAGLLFRPDRGPRPRTGLPVAAIAPESGWCDDPTDRAYNQPVELPCPASAEHLWRDDHLYDLVVVIDYNLKPARAGLGSAIFLHLATPDFQPTAGCVAIPLAAMRRLLPRLGPETVINIR